MEPRWLDWARRLQAIAQTGLTFSSDPFDSERYESLRAIAAEIMAAGSGAEVEAILELFARDKGRYQRSLIVTHFTGTILTAS